MRGTTLNKLRALGPEMTLNWMLAETLGELKMQGTRLLVETVPTSNNTLSETKPWALGPNGMLDGTLVEVNKLQALGPSKILKWLGVL